MKDVSWRKKQVEETKQKVKAELASNSFTSGAEKIEYLLTQINKGTDAADDLTSIERLVYAMSALFHHAQHGGLTSAQVGQLEQLVSNLLLVARVKPVRSKLAYLYGELYLVMSQIERQAGDHWRSAWLQQTAELMSRKDMGSGDGFRQLALAIRVFRLGQTSQAIALYRQAFKDPDLNERRRVTAGLGLMRALRISGNLQESIKAGGALEQTTVLTSAEQEELQWEEACRSCIEEGSPKVLLRLTRRGKPHYKSIYLLEANLWTMASSQQRHIESLPSLDYLRRKKKFGFTRFGLLYEAAESLSTCYDYKLPATVRIDRLGRVASQGYRFVTLEQELLFSLAATRALIRSRIMPLAKMCAFKYMTLAHIEQRNVVDPLGIGKDVVERFTSDEGGSSIAPKLIAS